MEMDVWSRQGTPSGSSEGILWWSWKCTTQISCYGRLITPAAAPLDSPLYSCQGYVYLELFPATMARVLRQAHSMRGRTPPRITMSQGLRIGLKSFLKIYCSLRLFLHSLLPQVSDLYCSLTALLAFPALSFKKSLAYIIPSR